MQSIKVGRRHHTFPQHYRKVIKGCDLKIYEVAEICGILPNRLYGIMNDKLRYAMSPKEFSAIKAFITAESEKRIAKEQK